MKQIATVIPGILNNLPTDERLAGFQWHENHLGEKSLVDAKGNPYPIRAVTCFTDKLGGQILMFHLTVLDSPLGLNATERDCKPTLVGLVHLQDGEDHIVRLEQLIDALQNCYIYDSEKDRDDQATDMMSVFSALKDVQPSGIMTELVSKLGVKVSEPFHIGFTGELKKMPQQLMNAIRWRVLGSGKLPKIMTPKDDIKAFSAGMAEIHENCVVLGASHGLTWDNDAKEWELVIGGTDDMPRGVFQYADMGLIFTEALGFLYEHVEKKYAEQEA